MISAGKEQWKGTLFFDFLGFRGHKSLRAFVRKTPFSVSFANFVAVFFSQLRMGLWHSKLIALRLVFFQSKMLELLETADLLITGGIFEIRIYFYAPTIYWWIDFASISYILTFPWTKFWGIFELIFASFVRVVESPFSGHHHHSYHRERRRRRRGEKNSESRTDIFIGPIQARFPQVAKTYSNIFTTFGVAF